MMSLDSGETWTEVSLPSDSLTTLAVKPTNGNVLLAATSYLDGILVSSDAGQTWTEDAGISAFDIVFSADGAKAYAATPQGVFRSDRDFLSWARTGLESEVVEVTVDPTDSRILYAADAYDATLLRSTDSGDHWRRVSDALPISGSPAFAVSATGASLFVGVRTGLLRFDFPKTRTLSPR